MESNSDFEKRRLIIGQTHRIIAVGRGWAARGTGSTWPRRGHFGKSPCGGLNTMALLLQKSRGEFGEVELVKSLGVEFRCGIEVAKTFHQRNRATSTPYYRPGSGTVRG